jgi:diacylglycerol kinase (ATP)
LAEIVASSYKVIVNPRSGHGSGARAEPILRRVLNETGARYDLVETRARGDATRLAYQARLDGWDTVVSVGGDGTAHEVVQGLVRALQANGEWQSDRPAGTLALIPLGTGNDYAARLGLPLSNPEAACRLMLQARPRAVDLGQVTDETSRTELFLNHLGAGFEAAALIESFQMQRLSGFVLYLTAALRVIPRHSRGWEMTVRYNGSDIKRPLNLASVANGGRTGGGFKIAPGAELDDGQLDLIMGHTPNAAVMLWLLPQVMRGTHVSQTQFVTAARTPSLIMEAPNGVPVHLDGELFRTDARRLEIDVLPRRLTVIAMPAG